MTPAGNVRIRRGGGRVAALVFRWLALWMFVGAAGADQPSSPSCALRYGYAMADHWLVVDLEQQIERTLFYAPGQEQFSSGFADLKAAIHGTEQELDKARQLYSKIYRTNSLEELIRLAAILTQIAQDESANEKKAERLLQEIGEHGGVKDFRAMMIARAKLEPSWD